MLTPTSTGHDAQTPLLSLAGSHSGLSLMPIAADSLPGSPVQDALDASQQPPPLHLSNSRCGRRLQAALSVARDDESLAVSSESPGTRAPSAMASPVLNRAASSWLRARLQRSRSNESVDDLALLASTQNGRDTDSARSGTSTPGLSCSGSSTGTVATPQEGGAQRGLAASPTKAGLGSGFLPKLCASDESAADIAQAAAADRDAARVKAQRLRARLSECSLTYSTLVQRDLESSVM